LKITILGTGYVGLVTGTCLAEIGHDVYCVDLDEKKIAGLKDGISPIYEPGIEDLIKRNIEQGRLHFTTNFAETLKDCLAVFIAVGTPETPSGSADLSQVRAISQTIGQKLDREMFVVVKSTVPVGTCDEVQEIINQELKTGKKSFTVDVLSNPEFLREGNAIEDFMKPDRIVVGANTARGGEFMQLLYQHFITDDPTKLQIVDRRSSELAKYASNSMLATRISFMNELSRFCELVGADIDNVRRAMGSDPRIGKKFLYAGPGYGGSCFPKDVKALINSGESKNFNFSILNAVDEANDAQYSFVAQKIKDHFSDLSGKKIAIWGLAFKPGTDDVRETPAAAIVDHLLEWGANVVAHDPKGAKNFEELFGQRDRLTFAKSAMTAIDGADAVVLVTEWPEYKQPDWDKVGAKLRTKVVFDFRNQYNAKILKEKGYFYRCIGRPDSHVAGPSR
jgi:UDPglucose 6-dehydrogenase